MDKMVFYIVGGLLGYFFYQSSFYMLIEHDIDPLTASATSFLIFAVFLAFWIKKLSVKITNS